MASDVGAVRARVLDALGEITIECSSRPAAGGSYNTATADRLMTKEERPLPREPPRRGDPQAFVPGQPARR
jgi:hypothetical protein